VQETVKSDKHRGKHKHKRREKSEYRVGNNAQQRAAITKKKTIKEQNEDQLK